MDITDIKRRNIFTLFLDLVNLKYTSRFANKSYFEQPSNNNLYGLSKMFDLYNIPNTAFKADDKKKVFENLSPPFVVHVDNDLGLVTKIDEQNVDLVLGGEVISTTKERFLKYWSGIALIAKPNENSAEPNYIKNKRDANFNVLKKCGLIITFIALFAVIYINNGSYKSVGVNMLLLVNILGAIISYFLLQKDLNAPNRIADKLCTILHNSDCNSKMREKSDSEIIGFKWSEIGFAYFASNILLLIFAPSYVYYIALINLLTLPYVFWSIWYQKFKAKQWCALCLLIQIILWAIFIINLIFRYIELPTVINYSAIIIIFSIYTLICLVMNFLMPKVQEWVVGIHSSLSLRRLKGIDEVFEGLLKRSPEQFVPKQFSKVFFGNPDAEFFVTVITNPHCAPCAKAHKVLEHLFSTSKNIAVQYIFTSFDVSLDSSS